MGATGLQGGAVARHLLANGWRVRALTRNAMGARAQALAALGAEVVQGDMADTGSLRAAMAGAYGVFSVQNPMISGIEGEVRQGKSVGTAAGQAGVRHLVYGSAGTGVKGTGVPSWESKLVVEEHLKSLGLPLTILRPMAFMELMTEKKFFPPLAAWYMMPRLMGSARPLPWLCTHDLGAIVAKVFADPGRFVGQELVLASDVKSLDECRAIYRSVMGRDPRRFPLPAWLFRRYGFVGEDLSAMWRWLRTGTVDLDTGRTLAIHPDALSVEAWLRTRKSVAGRAAR